MKFINKDLVDYLKEISNRLEKHKKISRKFIISKIFYFGNNSKINNKDILIEYNQNKHKPFEEMVGKQLFFFNPDELSFPIKDKVILFSLLFCNQKSRDIYYASLLHRLISNSIDKESNIYIWNPYSIWHYSLSYLKNHKTAYIHTPYYPFFQAETYYSNSFIRELYSLYKYHHYEISPNCEFREDTYKKIKIFLTQLGRESVAESKLIEFSKYLICNKKLTNIEIFLHYADRGIRISTTKLSGLEDFISHDKSLDNLSNDQISFSSRSSIGYDLLSLGLNHYIFYDIADMIYHYPELANYIANSDHFIKSSDNFDDTYNILNMYEYINI